MMFFCLGFSQAFFFILKTNEDPGLYGSYHKTWIGNFNIILYEQIERKGMTFDHDFGYYLPLFFSLLEKEGRRKGE